MSAELAERLAIVEQKLDLAIRAIHLLTASSKPASEWLDKGIEKIDDSRQIGVGYSARKKAKK